jgi:hypothetical protein
MPRVRKTEKEEEVDVKKPQIEPVCTRWFNENAGDDIEDLRHVANLTAKECHKQFNLNPCVSGEVYAVIFYATFIEILKYLQKQRSKYSNYTMEIGKSLNIGYVNNDNDDNEKVGSFDPVMEFIGSSTRNDKSEEDKVNIQKHLTNWKTNNVKSDANIVTTIENGVIARINAAEFNIHIGYGAIAFPIFCIFLDGLVSHVKYKWKEAQGTNVSTVSIDVFRLFRIKYSFNEEDNQECIEYEPLTLMKCLMKSDDISKTYIK